MEDVDVEEDRENMRVEQVAVVDTRLPRLNRLQTIRQQEKQYLKARQAQKVNQNIWDVSVFLLIS